jgi:tetratricopeptide (TPR) repeat protein
MASKTYPQDVRLHYLTGITAYELQQTNDAITHLEQAVALSDYFPQYVQNLVLVYTEMGSIKKAKQIVEQALLKHPNVPQLVELQVYVERLVITS